MQLRLLGFPHLCQLVQHHPDVMRNDCLYSQAPKKRTYEFPVVMLLLIAPDMLAIILRSVRNRMAEKFLLAMIEREAFDPNRSRRLLPQRAFA